MSPSDRTEEKNPNGPPAQVAEEAGEKSAWKNSWLALAAAGLASAGLAGGLTFAVLPAGVIAQLFASDSAVQSKAADNHDKTKDPASKKGHSRAKNPKSTEDSKKSSDDAAQSLASSFEVRGETGVFLLRPIVVTLRPQGRVRYLRVGLAVETSPDAEAAFIDRELRISDILNAYLRTVSVSALEDPAAMARIREQIARRIRFVVNDAPVNAVLITDFILS
jgi:flagellar basal body-associated protein FliL